MCTSVAVQFSETETRLTEIKGVEEHLKLVGLGQLILDLAAAEKPIGTPGESCFLETEVYVES